MYILVRESILIVVQHNNRFHVRFNILLALTSRGSYQSALIYVRSTEGNILTLYRKKFLNWTKLKAFAEIILIFSKMIISVFDRGEYNVGKV